MEEPAIPPPQSDPVARRGFSRWLRRLLVALLVAELAWVSAFEIAARTALLPWLVNRRPEKVAIAFAEAHSWLPLHFSVRGLELRGQTPSLRWRLTAERAHSWLAPWPLADRRARLVGARAQGLELQVRRGTPPGVDASASPAEGTSGPAPLAALRPRILALAPPPATARPQRPSWSFEVPRVAASGVREVWVDTLRFTGEAEATGGFAIRSGREVELFATTAALRAGQLAVGDEVVASALAGRLQAAIAPWPFRERRGRAVLPYLSGTIDLSGEVFAGGLLDAYGLSRWIDLERIAAPFVGHLAVAAGALEPGSRLELRPVRLATRFLQFEATGEAAVRFEVTRDAEGGRADLAVRYSEFEVRQSSDERAEIVGRGLAIAATTRDLGLHPPPYSGAARIDLGEARLADLALYDRLLPQSLPLELRGGSGTLAGGLEIDLATRAAAGEFLARIGGAEVRYDELDLAGNVEVDLALATSDLLSRRFDLAGTRLRLTDFRSPQAEAAGPAGDPGWWARIEIPAGEIVLPPEPAAKARFAIRLRDSVPIVGLFSARRNLPGWVENVLKVDDLAATGRLAWSPGGVTIDDFSSRFRDAALRARLRFGGRHRAGAMLVEWKGLALGLGLRDEDRELKLLGARDWFVEKAPGAMGRGGG